MLVSYIVKFLPWLVVLGLLSPVFVTVLQRAGWLVDTAPAQSPWQMRAPSEDAAIILTVERGQREIVSDPETRPVAAKKRDWLATSVPESQIPHHHRNGWWESIHQDGDLPALRDDRSPDDPSWDNSIAICACMFKENTTDIREWVLYHRCAFTILFVLSSSLIC
jgi:hypothetical protein